jgi:hypothetical protein
LPAYYRESGRGSVAIKEERSGIASETDTQLFAPFFTIESNGSKNRLTLVHEIFPLHELDSRLENHAGQDHLVFHLFLAVRTRR